MTELFKAEEGEQIVSCTRVSVLAYSFYIITTNKRVLKIKGETI